MALFGKSFVTPCLNQYVTNFVGFNFGRYYIIVERDLQNASVLQIRMGTICLIVPPRLKNIIVASLFFDAKWTTII